MKYDRRRDDYWYEKRENDKRQYYQRESQGSSSRKGLEQLNHKNWHGNDTQRDRRLTETRRPKLGEKKQKDGKKGNCYEEWESEENQSFLVSVVAQAAMAIMENWNLRPQRR